MAEIPLALYVHVPWCVAKCPYCDFNSHVAPRAVPAQRYAAAVLADLDLELARRPAPRALVSIFFGGGTPSLLAPGVVGALLQGIRRRVEVARDAEVTLEANPGTVERGRFAEYRGAGINRVSLGVQSFQDALLARLGRIHRAAEAVAAAEELHAAGIDNFNLDLMYALPGQRRAQARADVDAAVALEPAHISYYELTLEPGTAFRRRPPRLPPEGEAAAIERDGRDRLAGAGYRRYEISAFARAGRRCLHNENYWRYGDYAGIGPGAHGKRSAGRAIVRTERIRSPQRYLRLAGTAAAVVERPVGPAERAFEFMLGALRRPEGFTWAEFRTRTGLGRSALAPALCSAAADGLLEIGRVGARPSALGLEFLNELTARFLPA